MQNTIVNFIIKCIEEYYLSAALKLGIKDSSTGSITFIQRFGSALNLKYHLHLINIDGVYFYNSVGKLEHRNIPTPSKDELDYVISNIVNKLIMYLKSLGLAFDRPNREDLSNLNEKKLNYILT